jgi:hypothetical protein
MEKKEKENFVTLFDKNFLPQGITLYNSLAKTAPEFCLWVICIDSECKKILDQLNKPHIKTIELANVETEQLLKVKSERSRAEYCWTLSPFTPKFVFDVDNEVNRVTYIDADTYFMKNPSIIFKEFEASQKAVLISEHAYAPEYDQSTLSGKYCIQFMVFIRNEGESVRKWWEDRCIEWCYNRFEDGKFGDQKYLDSWPELFNDKVHVLSNKELLLAPWNATRFPHSNAVMYHFHGVRLLKNGRINLGNYLLPRILVKNVYGSYIKAIRESIEELKTVGYIYVPQQKISFIIFFKSLTSIFHNFFSLYKWRHIVKF